MQCSASERRLSKPGCNCWGTRRRKEEVTTCPDSPRSFFLLLKTTCADSPRSSAPFLVEQLRNRTSCTPSVPAWSRCGQQRYSHKQTTKTSGFESKIEICPKMGVLMGPSTPDLNLQLGTSHCLQSQCSGFSKYEKQNFNHQFNIPNM